VELIKTHHFAFLLFSSPSTGFQTLEISENHDKIPSARLKRIRAAVFSKVVLEFLRILKLAH
jgi:DNA polymerase III sliding clamp (beta) subunit (PCNA family)